MNTKEHKITLDSYINYMPFSNKLVKIMKVFEVIKISFFEPIPF
jgi:hypothetical protein